VIIDVNKNVVFYVTDSLDGKSKIRERLFSIWEKVLDEDSYSALYYESDPSDNNFNSFTRVYFKSISPEIDSYIDEMFDLFFNYNP